MQHRNMRYRGGMATLVAGVAMAAALAACGGGTTAASSPTTAPSTGSAPASTGGAFPGAIGSVAALSASSMEVQNPQTGQVTVSWTPSTVFSRSATLTAASVAAGDCVVVTGTTASGTFTARSLSVSQPSASGTCTANRPQGGGFGGFGRRAGGTGTTTPRTGTTPGTGANRRTGPPTSFAFGKVDSVSSSTLVITGTVASGRFGGPPTTTAPASTAPATSITVALDSSTTFTEIEPAAASNLAVGDCVTATGSTDSTGAVTARSVRITSTGGQSCTAGFGGFRGGTANG